MKTKPGPQSNFKILFGSCSLITKYKVSRSNLEGRLEGQDGLAEEGEHLGVGDLQGDLLGELQDGLQDDLQGALHQVGAVRATPKGSLQQNR